MFVKNMKKTLKLELEWNFKEIIVKYEKNLHFFRKLYKKAETFRISRAKISRKFEEKMKKKSKEFKRNKIKLIKLKNRKKENLKFRKIWKEFKEKLGDIWQTGAKLFQSIFWDSV